MFLERLRSPVFRHCINVLVRLQGLVANSALYVVTVNGSDAPKCKFWAETEFWMCLVENQNRKCFVIIIYFIKKYGYHIIVNKINDMYKESIKCILYILL